MYLLAPGLATTHLQGAWIGRRCEAEHLLREKRTGTKLGSRAEADNHVAPQCVRTVPADPLTRPSFPDLRIFPPSCLSQLSDVVRRPVFDCLFKRSTNRFVLSRSFLRLTYFSCSLALRKFSAWGRSARGIKQAHPSLSHKPLRRLAPNEYPRASIYTRVPNTAPAFADLKDSQHFPSRRPSRCLSVPVRRRPLPRQWETPVNYSRPAGMGAPRLTRQSTALTPP
ncbi:hypothetical protein K466DRAFT_344390 [Polyporus arcularius HHB13444]|uniref:Uncharacterized protein n=1 Tax=Polyporus arcularius HHB13444 TaxID=1314778 RepID=A0A5C3NWW4_9APHY|nr:hypothetical protein K466DRAFT_344390 [Polyporus arcularius HHB13444]